MGLLEELAGAPVEVEVDCYAGCKGDERPLRVRAGGEVFRVEAVLQQWYEPEEACFRVRVAGGVYVLRRRSDGGSWTLEPWKRRAGRGKQ